MGGANEDGIIFGTFNNLAAGRWSEDAITTARPYICEKNDQ